MNTLKQNLNWYSSNFHDVGLSRWSTKRHIAHIMNFKLRNISLCTIVTVDVILQSGHSHYERIIYAEDLVTMDDGVKRLMLEFYLTTNLRRPLFDVMVNEELEVLCMGQLNYTPFLCLEYTWFYACAVFKDRLLNFHNTFYLTRIQINISQQVIIRYLSILSWNLC